MIGRVWRGRASHDNAAAYPSHFAGTVVPELTGIAGFAGAMLLKRVRESDIEYVVITNWISLEAIKEFAGADYQRAVVEPGAIAALTDYESTVEHYEVVQSVRTL